jgi:translocation and assembly module TamA
MELILYLKNNIKLILLIINILFINNSFAEKIPEKIEKTKYHTLQVEILGAEPKLTEIIKNNLLIFQATKELKLTKFRIENLHDRADEEIIGNLQSLGYYHAKVNNANLKELNKNSWLASYTIELGDPTIIRQIDLRLIGEANNNYKLLQEINKIKDKYLTINQPINHENYESTKQSILTILHDYGFLQAQFKKAAVEINRKKHDATIVFIIESNQQYYLGPVIFESDRYPGDFLKKYIPFKEHTPYSTKTLMQLKNNLLNSGLFSKIRIDIPNTSSLLQHNNIIPVTVRTYAKNATTYNGSIGFGTDTSVRGSLGFIRRRVAHPGHQISINLMGSKIRKTIIADYSLPGANPTIDKYNFGISGTEEHVKERFNKNALLFIQKSKTYPTRQQFWKLNFLTENFKELPAKDKQHAQFLFPSAKFVWVHSHNRLDFTVKLASKVVSSTNLMQLTVNEKWIQPLWLDFQFIAKATLGLTNINNFNKLPLSLRFFAGGDYSIRGFSYQSLGPTATDKAGNTLVIGGKHLVLGSLELERVIYNQISASYFIDLGNAINKLNKLRYNNLAIASGIGLIYKTPIGSVRAYVAKPLQLPFGHNLLKKHIRFHLIFDTGL